MKKFALAGNPNCGKTTLFNSLTGSTAHVGNWPGVTVDKKEGTYKKLGEPIDIIDLPGIYSLSPYTPEEVISRNYILDEKPDCNRLIRTSRTEPSLSRQSHGNAGSARRSGSYRRCLRQVGGIYLGK